MKINHLLPILLAFFALISNDSIAFPRYTNIENDTVNAIRGHENLFSHGGTYVSGQPSKKTLKYLKSQGVQCIINLRSKDEIKTFEDEEYDEAELAKELELEYYNIPIEFTDDYNPKNLRKVSDIIDSHKHTLIHCSSGRRATWFYMGYLVDRKDFTVSDATDVGRQMKFTFLLEELTGEKVKFSHVEE